jgi:hypothetical protein
MFFFHIILSDQVFEHVSNINALTTELKRLTCSQGEGLHFFPAKWCLIETHLFIPIIHWLPKNKLRSWWIILMLDKIPVWRGMDNQTIDERVETYYQYTLQRTYYRPLSQLKNILKNQQFEVNFYSCASPKSRHRRLFPFLRFNNQFSSKLWNWYVNTFNSVVLATKRQ